MSLREVIDRTLSEIRLEAGQQRPARLPVVAFIDEIAATGLLHSEYQHIQFTVEPIDPALSIDADPQLLTSAVMNLLPSRNPTRYEMRRSLDEIADPRRVGGQDGSIPIRPTISKSLILND